MRRVAAALMLGMLLGLVSQAEADDTAGRRVAPPARPIPVSPAQLDALEQLSRRSEHAQVAQARASYSPEAARTMTEISVAATQIAIPASILTALIAAAPL
jgi:hypothetical protein